MKNVVAIAAYLALSLFGASTLVLAAETSSEKMLEEAAMAASEDPTQVAEEEAEVDKAEMDDTKKAAEDAAKKEGE